MLFWAYAVSASPTQILQVMAFLGRTLAHGPCCHKVLYNYSKLSTAIVRFVRGFALPYARGEDK